MGKLDTQKIKRKPTEISGPQISLTVNEIIPFTITKDPLISVGLRAVFSVSSVCIIVFLWAVFFSVWN